MKSCLVNSRHDLPSQHRAGGINALYRIPGRTGGLPVFQGRTDTDRSQPRPPVPGDGGAIQDKAGGTMGRTVRAPKSPLPACTGRRTDFKTTGIPATVEQGAICQN